MAVVGAELVDSEARQVTIFCKMVRNSGDLACVLLLPFPVLKGHLSTLQAPGRDTGNLSRSLPDPSTS